MSFTEKEKGICVSMDILKYFRSQKKQETLKWKKVWGSWQWSWFVCHGSFGQQLMLLQKARWRTGYKPFQWVLKLVCIFMWQLTILFSKGLNLKPHIILMHHSLGSLLYLSEEWAWQWSWFGIELYVLFSFFFHRLCEFVLVWFNLQEIYTMVCLLFLFCVYFG